MLAVLFSLALLLLLVSAAGAAPPTPGPLTFSLALARDGDAVADTPKMGAAPLKGDGVGRGPRLATVSFPFAVGEVATLAGVSVTTAAGTVPAQGRVLNRHRDGSVRRALVRFLWTPPAGGSETCRLNVLKTAAKTPGQVTAATADAFSLKAGRRTVRSEAAGIAISRAGKSEARLAFTGVEFPQRFLGPEVTVIEDGPFFSWLNLNYYGGVWNVSMEVQAGADEQVRCLVRLRRVSGGATPVPLFGLQVGALAMPFATDAPQTLPLATTVADGPRRLRFGEGRAATPIELPDGPQVRQGRLAVSLVDGAGRLTLLRDISLDRTVADEHKQFQEGQERAVELLFPSPSGRASLPVAAVAARRRCVAVTGEAPVNYGRLQPIRELNSRQALKLACRDGDQYGDVTSSVNRTDPHWTMTGLTRIDIGLDMLEDYYHGGDPRLRDLAVDWAENWVSLKQYRGWDVNSLGGERYTMASWQSIPSFNQKGIMMVAYAYEETGDPRYQEAAIAFADRIVAQLRTRWFVAGTSTAPTGIGGDANIRPGYLGRDLVLMYRWTGNRAYLAAARRIFYGLAALRTGDYGLLREGYSDPYSPFERLVTGTDLGVTEDNSDHLKPYILEYLLEGAQYVYEETGDEVARATMVSLSDFMLGAMQRGGFWNYAQRHAAEGNSIQHMTVEIANGLLKSYQLSGDKRYKEAAFSSLHCICKAFATYGSFLEGVVPPPDRHYFYPGDHCDLDFYRGSVGIDNINRDPTGYLFTAMDRVLRLDPRADELLLSPPTEPRHKWLLEAVPLSGQDVVHEQGYNYIARLNMGADGDAESGGRSNLVLLEDGKPLGPPHSLHQAIRDEGKGRYSHWGRAALYFSASDNSNPLTNGRHYTWYYGSPDQIAPPAQQQQLPTLNTAYAGRKPHPAAVLFEQGLKAEREGRYLEAVAVWEQVLGQWPDSAPELYRQIALYQQAGQPEQRAAACRRFLSAFPRHDRAPEVRMTLAEYLLAEGRKDEARAVLEETLKQHPGGAWAEEAQVCLWRELGVGVAPPAVIRAAKGNAPQPQPVVALLAADGLVSSLAPQIGAAYDDRNLYLTMVLPLAAPWPSPDTNESLRLYMDPGGDLTSYQLYVVDAAGGQAERPAMWHNRLQGIVAGQGWQLTVTRQPQSWTAAVTIPFSKLGFTPNAGRHTMRLGYRWDSLTGMKLWRPSMPWYTRPQDCGWLVFE